MSKILSLITLSLIARTGASAAIAILCAITSAPLEAQNTSISGVVKNAAGEPVAGAIVKIKNDGLGMAFTVVSQGEGRYTSPILPAGRYQVQAFGGSNQGISAGPVDVGSG